MLDRVVGILVFFPTVIPARNPELWVNFQPAGFATSGIWIGCCSTTRPDMDKLR